MGTDDSTFPITLNQPSFAISNATGDALESKLSYETGKSSSTIVSDNDNIVIQEENAPSKRAQAVSLVTTYLVAEHLESSKRLKHEKETLKCHHQARICLIVEQE